MRTDKASRDDFMAEFRQFVPFASRARKDFSLKAKVATLHDKGACHVFADFDSAEILHDTKLLQGMMRVPIIPTAVDHAIATIHSTRSNFEPLPLGTTTLDMVRSEAAQLILDEFDRYNPVHENNLVLTRDIVNTGRGFKRLQVYQDYVPVIISPEELMQVVQEEQMRMGLGGSIHRPIFRDSDLTQLGDGMIRIPMLRNVIREALLSPFSILADTGVTNLDECLRFACHELRTIDWVIHEYEKRNPQFDFDKLTPLHIKDKDIPNNAGDIGNTRYIYGGGQQGGDSFNGSFGFVRHFDYYRLLPDMTYMHLIVIQDGRDYHPIVVETVGYHPYIDYHCRRRVGDFWGEGLTYNATDVARAYCINKTDIQRNMQESMKDIIVAHQSLKKSLTNEFATIVYAPSMIANPIQRLGMPSNAHQMLMQLSAENKADVYEIFGLSDISRGIVKSHVANATQDMARRVDHGRLGMVRRFFDESEARLRKKVLRMAKTEYTESRFIVSANSVERGTVMARAVSGHDLSGVFDIQIVESAERPRTFEERLMFVKELAPLGFFGSRDEVFDYLKMQRGKIPEPTIDIMEESRADLETIWLERGQAMYVDQITTGEANVDGQLDGRPGPVLCFAPGARDYGLPLIRDTDIHEKHLDRHLRAKREGRFSQEVMRFVDAHIMEHQMELQKAEEQARASALEMEARMSEAKQAGQAKLMEMNIQNRPAATPLVAPMTPEDGGVLSGAIRRGEQL